MVKINRARTRSVPREPHVDRLPRYLSITEIVFRPTRIYTRWAAC